MTNLPKGFRDVLSNEYPLIEPRVVNKQVSNDGTRKYVFEYADGARLKPSGIPSFDKKSAETSLSTFTVLLHQAGGAPWGALFAART